MTTWLQAAMFLCTVLSCGCAVFSALRAGDWRKNDELRAMINAASSRWHDTPQAVALEGRVRDVEAAVVALETTMESLPTKADLAQVAGEVETANRLLDAVQKGVNRIEGYMMEKGR